MQNQNILSIINQKIAKLDEVLFDFRSMRPGSQSSIVESLRPASSTMAKTVASKKGEKFCLPILFVIKKLLNLEKESKEIHQFAGIYSMKSVFFDTTIPVPEAHTGKEDASKNKPKLIELYQYPGYEKDSLTPLAHNMKINDVIEKAINSIEILNRQVFKKFSKIISFQF